MGEKEGVGQYDKDSQYLRIDNNVGIFSSSDSQRKAETRNSAKEMAAILVGTVLGVISFL